MQRFADIEAWVFDLDNTLYPASQNLFEQIDQRMTKFIMQALQVECAEAYRVQKQFLGEYGTTLSGLMTEHGLPPGPFLDFVHDIDLAQLDPNPALAEVLATLPGRKFIFTNSTSAHAERVLQQLGLQRLFADVFDIVAANYVPKPNADIYQPMLKHFGITARNAAFFEDMARNLTPAHKLGMTTILVHENGADSTAKMNMPELYRQYDDSHIDHKTSDLTGFLRTLMARQA